MLKIKELVNKSEYGRNILTILSGTVLAQIIPIAIAPILTRVYSPQEFGMFAMLMGGGVVLSAISTGRYDFAIVLVKKRIDAIRLVLISLILSLFVLLVILIAILMFKENIRNYLEIDAILLYLLLLSVFFTAIYQIKSSFFIREKNFKKISVARIYQSLSMSIVQVFLGLVSGFSNVGLLAGFVIGQIVAVNTLPKIDLSKKAYQCRENKVKILAVARKYIDYPKIDVPNAILNIGSAQAPNILFGLLFSPIYAGFFLLTQRVLQAPVSLISFSFLEVFKEKASSDYRKYGVVKKIYKKTFLVLFSIGIIPSLVLFFIIEDMFIYVFGIEWAVSGLYAQIMIPAMFLRFVISPLSFMFHIAGKQRINLITQVFLFCFVLMSMFFSESHLDVVKNISIVYSMYYLSHFVFSLHYAGFKIISFFEKNN